MRPWKDLRIKHKLVLAFTAAVLLPLGGAFALMWMVLQGQMERSTAEQVQHTQNHVDLLLKEFKSKSQGYVRLMARDKALAYATFYTRVAGERTLLLQELSGLYGLLDLNLLEVVDPKGRSLARAQAPQRYGTTSPFQNLIQRAASGRPGVEVGEGDAGYAILAAGPIENQGEIIGVVLAGYHLSDRLAGEIARLSGAQVLFLGPRRIVASSLAMETPPPWALATGPKIPSRTHLNGRPYRLSVFPLKGGTDAIRVVVAKDATPFLENRQRFFGFMALIGLLSLGAAVGLGFLLATHFSRPVVAAASFARHIAEGRMDQRIPITSRDEMGHLVQSLNRMAEDLERSHFELEATQSKLIQAEKLAATGKLAAHVGHEINNPLGILRNYLTILRRQIHNNAQEADLQASVTVLKEEITRIARIVQELLDLHRPSDTHVARISLNALVSGFLGLMDQHLEDRNIRLFVNLSPEDAQILAHPDKLKQVLLNLVKNAEHAMRHGGELRITTEATEDRVTLTVADTGEGIPPDVMTHIFDPFFTTRSQGGTGLGLSVSRGIIRSYGGSMRVESDLGEGTRFTVTLPRLRVPTMDHVEV